MRRTLAVGDAPLDVRRDDDRDVRLALLHQLAQLARRCPPGGSRPSTCVAPRSPTSRRDSEVCDWSSTAVDTPRTSKLIA